MHKELWSNLRYFTLFQENYYVDKLVNFEIDKIYIKFLSGSIFFFLLLV